MYTAKNARNAQLTSRIFGLIEISKTQPHAINHLYEIKRQVAADRKMLALVDDAILYALKNA